VSVRLQALAVNIIADHIGKWGKFQRQCITDEKVSQIVEECSRLPGYEVFKYSDDEGELKDVKSRELNAYVKEVMGPDFTAKDFRTWAGTLVAAVKLAELGATENLKVAEKNVVAAIDAVAERLGNTRAIARSSYVSPRVIEHYMEGAVIAYYSDRIEEVIVAEQGDLTEGEKALLDLLKKKLRRELEKAA
jgi:DNA topoisomerase I